MNPHILEKIIIKRNKDNWNFYIENTNIPECKGFYFIFNKNNTLIYIGQSIHINTRIEQHSQTSIWFKYFAHKISFIEIEDGDLNKIEMNYILKYNPRFNSQSINYDNNYTGFNFMLNQKTNERMDRRLETRRPEVK
jgi:excinuclease UvrABC nuclease subunit